MIRRVSKHNDLKDIIKSCPSGVIDDIYSIQYYIQGHNVVIDAEFTRVGDCLQAILPTNQLELLPNGILMRRAFYKVIDSSYPDGYYNLEFEDCMNIWLGDEESEEPVHPEYVTEDELSSTLSSYATKKFVTDRTDLLEEHDVIMSAMISDCATREWVVNQEYATQSWVSSNFLSSGALSSYATQSWVESQGYLTSHQDLTGYATQSWATSQFLEESKIWTGTESQWNQLTPAQKATYIIALITE